MDQRDATIYRTSSFCSGSTCVEVADLPDGSTAVRSHPEAAHPLVIGRAAWAAFLLGVKAGQFATRRG